MSGARNQLSTPSPSLLIARARRRAVVEGAMTNSSPLLFPLPPSVPPLSSAGIDQTVKSSCEFNELISDAAATAPRF